MSIKEIYGGKLPDRDIYREICEERERMQENGGKLENYLEKGIWAIRITSPERYRWIMESFGDQLDFDRDEIRLLDLGSSTGIATENLAEQLEEEYNYQIDAYAVDQDGEVMKECRSQDHAIPVRASVNDLPFESGKFELVVSDHLHLNDFQEIFREIDRVVHEKSKILLGRGYINFGLHEGRVDREKGFIPSD